MSTPSAADAAARAAQAAQACGAKLRDAGIERRVEAIAEAMTELQSTDGEHAQQLRSALHASTGLSPQMVQWGLSSAAGAIHEAALTSLATEDAASEPGQPPSLVAVVLSGNVFSAPLRALVLPLLIGAPVVCKASSRDDALAHAFARELREADPELGEALQVVTFGREDAGALSAMLADASRVSVYGDDETVAQIAAVAPAGARVLEHGHGVGAIYIPWQCLREAREAQAVARRVAIDVCAYDQRGCLSPHFVLVQSGGSVDASGFSRLLHEQAMVEMQTVLPRGQLDDDAEAQQMQWRGVAKARGTLLEGEAYAVSDEGKHPLRLSPGYRNVGIYDCSSALMCTELLHPFEPHLKIIGVGEGGGAREQIAGEFDGGPGPHLCEIGTMQTPTLDAPQDGKPPLHGLR